MQWRYSSEENSRSSRLCSCVVAVGQPWAQRANKSRNKETVKGASEREEEQKEKWSYGLQRPTRCLSGLCTRPVVKLFVGGN